MPLGAGGQLDAKTAQKTIIGFMFSSRRPMDNQTLAGAKITRLDR
jgi:hypothetical protein